MTEQELIKLFIERSALLEGHFRLTSGLHSNRYIQCAQVLQYPDLSAMLGEKLAAPFSEQGVNLVVGPAIGGSLLPRRQGVPWV